MQRIFAYTGEIEHEGKGNKWQNCVIFFRINDS